MVDAAVPDRLVFTADLLGQFNVRKLTKQGIQLWRPVYFAQAYAAALPTNAGIGQRRSKSVEINPRLLSRLPFLKGWILQTCQFND